MRDWYYLQHQNEQTAQPDLFIRDACAEIIKLQERFDALSTSHDGLAADKIELRRRVKILEEALIEAEDIMKRHTFFNCAKHFKDVLEGKVK
jgi:hypothetical protein